MSGPSMVVADPGDDPGTAANPPSLSGHPPTVSEVIADTVADSAAIPLLLAADGDAATAWRTWLAARRSVDRAVASRLRHTRVGAGAGLLAAVASSLATGIGDVDALAEHAEATADGPTGRADAVRAVAKLGTWHGDTLHTAARTEQAADDIAPIDRRREAHLRLDAATIVLNAGHLTLAEGAARRARVACSACPDLVATAELLLACTRSMLGERVAITPPDGAALSALGDGDVRLGVLVARVLVWNGRHDEARALLARSMAAAKASAPDALAFVMEVVADLEFRAGGWPTGEATADAAEARCQHPGNRNVRALLLVRRARFDAVRGDADACQARLDDAERIERHAALINVRLHIASTRALLAIGDGQHERALAHALRARQIAGDMALGLPGLDLFHGDLIEALVRTDQPDAAARTIDELERIAAHLSHAPALAIAMRGRLLLGTEPEIEALAQTALDHHDQVSLPFERARTLLVLAERRRRAGQRRAARVAASAAHAEFLRLGAVPWARRALTELRAAGARLDDLDATTDMAVLGALSPQEQQVVRVVVDGATNHEAAMALFLSPKSIERHLTAIYRKLRLRSRSELVRWFDLQTDPPVS